MLLLLLQVVSVVMGWEAALACHEDELQVCLQVLLAACTTLDGCLALRNHHGPALLPALRALAASAAPPHGVHQTASLSSRAVLWLLGDHTTGPAATQAAPPFPPYDSEARLHAALASATAMAGSERGEEEEEEDLPPPPDPSAASQALQQRVACEPVGPQLATCLAEALLAGPLPLHVALQDCWAGLLARGASASAATAQGGNEMDEEEEDDEDRQRAMAAGRMMGAYATGVLRGPRHEDLEAAEEEEDLFSASLCRLHQRAERGQAGAAGVWVVGALLLLAGACRVHHHTTSQPQQDDEQQQAAAARVLAALCPADGPRPSTPTDRQHEEVADAAVALLHRFSPHVLAAVEAAGLAPGPLLASWSRQCFVRVLGWRQAAVYTLLGLAGARQAQVGGWVGEDATGTVTNPGHLTVERLLLHAGVCRGRLAGVPGAVPEGRGRECALPDRARPAAGSGGRHHGPPRDTGAGGQGGRRHGTGQAAAALEQGRGQGRHGVGRDRQTESKVAGGTDEEVEVRRARDHWLVLVDGIAAGTAAGTGCRCPLS